MKSPQSEHRYFFVDEAGDPAFYSKGKKWIVGMDGCSRMLSLGFLRTAQPEEIRAALLDLRERLRQDRYLADIPSMHKTLVGFHAKDDCPEVRKAVFDTLHNLNFSVQVVAARKLERIFHSKHHRSQDLFYNELVSHLFERQLHLANENTITFARRGDKTKQHALRNAVEKGVTSFRTRYPAAASTSVRIETKYAADDPVLQAADYALWAVQRAFERREMRYFEFLRDKFEMVWDIYDFAAMQAGQPTIYTRKIPFHVDKASPLS